GAVIVALVLAVPAAAFTFWPFLRQRDRPAPLLPLPSDEREQLTEAKRAALRALRELDFEHAAGHVSDADYAGLRARYEAETADTLRALDALGPAPAVPAPAEGRPTPAPARACLFAGRYGEAIAAYQAVLKRDPNNVDALTHMGLIAAVAARSEHGPEMVDRALGLLDRALALSPDYPPALLYRGQVLYEGKKDAAGAIRSWERFVKVVPAGEERARVERR